MTFEVLSKLQRFETVELLNGLSQTLVILIFEINLIQSLVNCGDVLVLNTLEEGSNQSYISGALHNLNTLG